MKQNVKYYFFFLKVFFFITYNIILYEQNQWSWSINGNEKNLCERKEVEIKNREMTNWVQENWTGWKWFRETIWKILWIADKWDEYIRWEYWKWDTKNISFFIFILVENMEDFVYALLPSIYSLEK